MTPGTELPFDFYAGIGPLQLGVVLVIIIIGRKTFEFRGWKGGILNAGMCIYFGIVDIILFADF